MGDNESPDDTAARAVVLLQDAIIALRRDPMRWHEGLGLIEDARDLLNAIDTNEPQPKDKQ